MSHKQESQTASYFEKMQIPTNTVTRLGPMVYACMSTHLVPILIGIAGCGKTELIKQIARALNAHLVHLYAAHSGSEDIRGLMFRSHKTSETFSILSSEELYEAVQIAREGKPVVLFLDELNRASDVDTLNALFSMLSKRGVPGLDFPDNLYIVAAGNPPTGNFQVAQMDDNAYVRRLVWFGVKADASVWLKYAKGKSTFTIPTELATPPERLPIHDKVISYIKQNPTRLFDEALADSGAPHPNPASWDRVSDILKTLESMDEASPYNVRCILSGLIGGVLANNFYEHYAEGDLTLSPDDVLDLKWSEVKATLEELRKQNRHDLYSDLVNSVCFMLINDMPILRKKQVENLSKFVVYLDEDQQALFGKLIGSVSAVEHPEWEAYETELMLKLQKNEEFRDVLDRLNTLRQGNIQ